MSKYEAESNTVQKNCQQIKLLLTASVDTVFVPVLRQSELRSSRSVGLAYE